MASFLALFPYAVAYAGWMAISFVPYLAGDAARIVGRPSASCCVAFPMVFTNTLVGQNGFLTAALIGGTLYLMPVRPVLAGICLGLLSYKPQYGLLFPIVLIAAAQWRVFISAGVTTVVLAFVSWLAFGTESWQAFVALDADVLASLPQRGQGDLVEAAEPLFAGALSSAGPSRSPGRCIGCSPLVAPCWC